MQSQYNSDLANSLPDQIGNAKIAVTSGNEPKNDAHRTDAETKPKPVDLFPLDTIQSDVWHLYHLIDAAVDYMQDNLDFARNDDGYSPHDRLAALSWIARDQAERIAKYIDENYHSIRRGNV